MSSSPRARARARARLRARARSLRLVLPLSLLLLLPGCPRARTSPTPHTAAVPIPTVRVGDCATPGQDGVHGEHPRLRRADRDLDGDGTPEAVVADETMCTADGNCYWNVFVRTDVGGCDRYAGALAGAVLEPQQGGTGWPPVRTYWNLSGGRRVLVQEYQFRRGGYVLSDTLVCRREADDRLQCTEDTR